MSKISYYTEKGLKELRQKLDHLKDIERPLASKAIGEARDKGDLSENAEYDAAKEAQGMLEMEISKLEETLSNARIIDESKLESYFINDINFTHELSLPNYADELKLKVLVNNIFDLKYTSYGGYYTYDLPEGQGLNTYEGTYYYPQSGINILVGLDIKF